MPEREVGTISHYFARIGVAGIELTAPLAVGETIRVKGHTTDFSQLVDSMQMDNDVVSDANAGASVGIKVIERCREGDQVFVVEAPG